MKVTGWTAKAIEKKIKAAGWRRARVKGGHRVYAREGSTQMVVIPWHKGSLKPKTAQNILRQAGLIPPPEPTKR